MSGGLAVQAQSLLSLPLSQWDARLLDEAADPEPEVAPLHPRPTLSHLLDLVESGRAKEAYPFLLELFREDHQPPDFSAAQAEQLHRRMLRTLLRAGEGIATPQDQEVIARAFVEQYPDDEEFPLSHYRLTEALYNQGLPLEASFFFDTEALASLPAWMQSRYLVMQAETAARQGDDMAAARYLLFERESPTTLRGTPRVKVLAALARLPSPDHLNRLLEEFPDATWLVSEHPFLEAQTLVNAGETVNAALTLERLEDSGVQLDAAQFKRLRETQEVINQAMHTRHRRIGVLLPLGSGSESLRILAWDILDGLRMAVQFRGGTLTFRREPQDNTSGELEPVVAGEPHAGPTFELVVRDTANRVEDAAQLVEDLVREEHVMAIVGPLARRESMAAMAVAERVGVPLISLSVSAEIPQGSHYTFRHNMSREAEIRDLVRYAMDYLNARRFAILYPNNSYGELMRDLFWDEVHQQDGKVVGMASFLSQDTRNEVEAAVGMKGLFESLAGMNRYLPPATRRLIEEEPEDHPDPVIQFDALFIPIHPGGVPLLRLIAAYPPTVDAEDRVILGNRHWNNDSVAVAAADKLRGSVFLDAYYRESSSEANQAFRAQHRRFFRHRAGYRPPSYYTALAYDTLGILDKLLTDPGVRTREQLALELSRMEPFHGLTGLTSFSETGLSIKESQVLTFEANRIQLAVP